MTSTTVSKDPRFTSPEGAAKNEECTVQTILNYVDRGWIIGYVTPSGKLYVDLNEIDEARTLHPRMKRKKARFAPTARIEPLPAPAVQAVEQ